MKKTIKTAKIIISAEAAEHNFNTLAAELIRTAPSEKALAFAEKIITDVRARGTQWMAENATELQILDVADTTFCPVEDNRNYYMAALQVALIK